jgi:hypothetical protein
VLTGQNDIQVAVSCDSLATAELPSLYQVVAESDSKDKPGAVIELNPYVIAVKSVHIHRRFSAEPARRHTRSGGFQQDRPNRADVRRAKSARTGRRPYPATDVRRPAIGTAASFAQEAFPSLPRAFRLVWRFTKNRSEAAEKWPPRLVILTAIIDPEYWRRTSDDAATTNAETMNAQCSGAHVSQPRRAPTAERQWRELSVPKYINSSYDTHW